MIIMEINCVEVWGEISNYIDGTEGTGGIDPEMRRRMDAHFKQCQHCTAILDGTRNVVHLVGDGHAFELPAGFSERLRARIDNSLK